MVAPRSKKPSALDVDDVFNDLFATLWSYAENAEKLYHDTSLTLERRYECIKHTMSRACGIIDAINILGYDVRGADGQRVTDKPYGKLFYLEQAAEIELRKERK